MNKYLQAMGIDQYVELDVAAAADQAPQAPEVVEAPAVTEIVEVRAAATKAIEVAPVIEQPAAADLPVVAVLPTYYTLLVACEHHLLFSASLQPLEPEQQTLFRNIARFAEGAEVVPDRWPQRDNAQFVNSAADLATLFRAMLEAHLQTAKTEHNKQLLPVLLGQETLQAMALLAEADAQDTAAFEAMLGNLEHFEKLPACAVAPSLADMLSRTYLKAEMWRCLRYRA